MTILWMFVQWISVAMFIAWLALCVIRPTVAPATFEVILRGARWMYAASHGYCEFMELLRAHLPAMFSRARWVTRRCYADITTSLEDAR